MRKVFAIICVLVAVLITLSACADGYTEITADVSDITSISAEEIEEEVTAAGPGETGPYPSIIANLPHGVRIHIHSHLTTDDAGNAVPDKKLITLVSGSDDGSVVECWYREHWHTMTVGSAEEYTQTATAAVIRIGEQKYMLDMVAVTEDWWYLIQWEEINS